MKASKVLSNLFKSKATKLKETNEELKSITLKRLKDYFTDEPYVQDSIWSWSQDKRIDLIFPEVMFKQKQTGKTILFGIAFQVVDLENPKEIEEYRDLFTEAGIPSVLINTNEIPASKDLISRIEGLFSNEYTLLSIN